MAERLEVFSKEGLIRIRTDEVPTYLYKRIRAYSDDGKMITLTPTENNIIEVIRDWLKLEQETDKRMGSNRYGHMRKRILEEVFGELDNPKLI